MSENFIDMLKQKEDEMAAVIEEAKKTAILKRERAYKEADEIKGNMAGELDEEIKALNEAFDAALDAEVRAVEENAAEEAGEIERAARPRLSKAIEYVKAIIADSEQD
jgi:hypothetical protein